MTGTKFRESISLKNRQFWKKHIIFEDDTDFCDKNITTKSTSTAERSRYKVW